MWRSFISLVVQEFRLVPCFWCEGYIGVLYIYLIDITIVT